MRTAKLMTEEQREDNRRRAREWRQRPGNKEREQATKQAFREAHPEQWREQRLAASRRYWAKNGDRLKSETNASRALYRIQIMEAYGGRCNCPGCHVHHAVLLTVDHINGDGAEHRKQLGRSTRDMYRWIVKHDFPPDFQLLCGSCNLAKSNKEQCPLAGEEH